MGYHLESIHQKPQVIEEVDAIVVGGGNTFQLLKVLQERDLMEPIRQRVMKDNIPYVGWSAGANIVCPTIGTTNDMPITEPQSFKALGLVPFQINPHYLDASVDGHFGETREERILEFLEINRKVHVVGLREGTMLTIVNSKIRYHGIADKTCRIFKYGQSARELGSSDNFNFLLTS
jgi:dipeptidase E